MASPVIYRWWYKVQQQQSHLKFSHRKCNLLLSRSSFFSAPSYLLLPFLLCVSFEVTLLRHTYNIYCSSSYTGCCLYISNQRLRWYSVFQIQFRTFYLGHLVYLDRFALFMLLETTTLQKSVECLQETVMEYMLNIF